MAFLRLHTTHLSWFVPSEGYYNELGEWEEQGGLWQGDIPCEVKPSGGQMSQLITEDGVLVYYSHTIYIKARYSGHQFKYGDKIRLVYEDGREKEFTIKGFEPRQLQTKLWV